MCGLGKPSSPPVEADLEGEASPWKERATGCWQRQLVATDSLVEQGPEVGRRPASSDARSRRVGSSCDERHRLLRKRLSSRADATSAVCGAEASHGPAVEALRRRERDLSHGPRERHRASWGAPSSALADGARSQLRETVRTAYAVDPVPSSVWAFAGGQPVERVDVERHARKRPVGEPGGILVKGWTTRSSSGGHSRAGHRGAGGGNASGGADRTAR